MDTRRTYSRWKSTLLAGLVVLSGGCFHTQGVVVAPPPDGAVPTELNPVVLPRYIISPPDILYVQVLLPPYNHFLPTNEPLKPGDPAEQYRNYFSYPISPQPIEGQHTVQMDGTID